MINQIRRDWQKYLTFHKFDLLNIFKYIQKIYKKSFNHIDRNFNCTVIMKSGKMSIKEKYNLIVHSITYLQTQIFRIKLVYYDCLKELFHWLESRLLFVNKGR